jgi:hypothetical protein
MDLVHTDLTLTMSGCGRQIGYGSAPSFSPTLSLSFGLFVGGSGYDTMFAHVRWVISVMVLCGHWVVWCAMAYQVHPSCLLLLVYSSAGPRRAIMGC